MKVAFIGFGEAAGAFVEGWGSGAGLRGYDRKTDDPATREAKRADFARLGVTPTESAPEAVAGAEAVFSVVTADQNVAAASAAAPGLAPGALWLDCNSSSPGAKREAAAVIEAAGGRYVDVAVMSPVYPKRHEVPLLLTGPAAEAAAEALKGLGMKPEVAGHEVGRASAIKMIRSVMVKGIEALSAECVLAAVRAGVADEVLASLNVSHPGREWVAQTGYNLERMEVHGLRRAAEMREVVRTLQELGLAGAMADATTRWQQRLGELALPQDIAADAGGPERARRLLDAMGEPMIP